MKNNLKKVIFATLAGLGFASNLMADGTNQLLDLTDEKSRVSYALGMMTGSQWKAQQLNFDPDVYARGIKDAMTGNGTLLTPEEAKMAIDNFKNEFMAQQQQLRYKADGEAFLATNKHNPGVITTPDGLQYLVVTNGSGAVPAADDVVTVNYRGTLLNGTEFDNSYKRGRPLEFPVNGVIRGWTEALQMMHAGSKWKLFIPAGLAYGEQGRPSIPPNSVLIFEVDLISVKPSPAPVSSDIIKVQGTNAEVIKVGDAAKAHKK